MNIQLRAYYHTCGQMASVKYYEDDIAYRCPVCKVSIILDSCKRPAEFTEKLIFDEPSIFDAAALSKRLTEKEETEC